MLICTLEQGGARTQLGASIILENEPIIKVLLERVPSADTRISNSSEAAAKRLALQKLMIFNDAFRSRGSRVSRIKNGSLYGDVDSQGG